MEGKVVQVIALSPTFVDGAGSLYLIQVPGVAFGIEREHVVARRKPSMIKVAWKMAGTFAVTSFVVFDTLRSHTLLFLCLWEKIARVRLHLVALFGEMLLILGEHKLIEELGFM